MDRGYRTDGLEGLRDQDRQTKRTEGLERTDQERLTGRTEGLGQTDWKDRGTRAERLEGQRDQDGQTRRKEGLEQTTYPEKPLSVPMNSFSTLQTSLLLYSILLTQRHVVGVDSSCKEKKNDLDNILSHRVFVTPPSYHISEQLEIEGCFTPL